MRFGYLSSNLALMSALAFLFKAGSLNKSLLTLFLSKLISTEYLFIQNKEKNYLQIYFDHSKNYQPNCTIGKKVWLIFFVVLFILFTWLALSGCS